MELALIVIIILAVLYNLGVLTLIKILAEIAIREVKVNFYEVAHKTLHEGIRKNVEAFKQDEKMKTNSDTSVADSCVEPEK